MRSVKTRKENNLYEMKNSIRCEKHMNIMLNNMGVYKNLSSKMWELSILIFFNVQNLF